MELTDYELIQKCLAGRQEYFEDLVTRYKKLIYSIVYNMISDKEEVNDIEIVVRLPKRDLSWSELLASTPVPANSVPPGSSTTALTNKDRGGPSGVNVWNFRACPGRNRVTPPSVAIQ